MNNADTLGNITGIASTRTGGQSKTGKRFLPEKKNDLNEDRALRYKLLSVASRILPDERVAKCSKYLIKGVDAVTIKRNPTDNKAWFSGVQHCSSIWNCPVCSNRITEFRRQELEKALDNPRYDVVLVTYTVRHDIEDKLKGLIEAIMKSYNLTKNGRFYQELKAEFGIVGAIRTVEVPYNEDNGWHVHIHELLVLDKTIMDRESADFYPRVQKLRTRLKKRWLHCLEKHGRDASWERGLHINARKDVKKTYIAKAQLSSELTRMANKKSRANAGVTPFGMLDKVRNGENKFITLFQEYAACFKGSQQLRWSAGLKELLGVKHVEDNEITEETIATPDAPEFEEVATLYWDEWAIIFKNDLRGELLKIASVGGKSAVTTFLDELWARGSP